MKLTGHAVTLSPARQALVDALERTFLEAAFQPPSVEEALSAQDSRPADARALLQVLVDQDRLVRLKGDVFYHREALGQIEQRLRAHLEAHREITAGEFRDMLEISRKYAIPLLEHFDGQRITPAHGGQARPPQSLTTPQTRRTDHAQPSDAETQAPTRPSREADQPLPGAGP